MAKLPLFIKNGDKYELIPVQLEQFSDGKWGYWYDKVMGQGNTNPYWVFWLKHGCHHKKGLLSLEFVNGIGNRVVINDR